MNLGMERELTMPDYIILDQIRRFGTFDDYAMSYQFHCSRLFLLERLKWLVLKGYCIQEEGGFALTEAGRSAWMPLSLYHEAEQAPKNAPSEFCWTELYIPRPGWSDF